MAAHYDEVAPNASSMIESMRAYGYSMSTAIADLVDNSISAEANNVWIDLHWAGDESWVRIVDDGRGMTEEQLIEAMRLGSTNPRHERSPADLGRFGLGLKTASLSQGRCLTVCSRVEGASRAALRCWDLDYLARDDVRGWQLLRTVSSKTMETLTLQSQGSGTVVLIERLDRLVGSGDVSGSLQAHVLDIVAALEAHLAMVFHRYLARRNRSLQIHLNGNTIEPWDPFLENHHATQPTVGEVIRLTPTDDPVSVKGFVLPHIDRLSKDEHADAAGPAGWNAQQGFYLYRNERLIVAGSWLGLGGSRGWTQEEHYKLARIRVDIPNSMDHLWHLDVKKSSATPPPALRGRLKGLADTVRQRARSVYAHRGRIGSSKKGRPFERPWQVLSRGGGRSYKVNRDHPLISTLKSSLTGDAAVQLESVLRVLEETVPVEQIWLDVAEKPDGQHRPFRESGTTEIKQIIRVTCDAIQRRRNVPLREALQIMLLHEEFSSDEAQSILSNLLEVSDQ